jgi:hypothetical protein
MTNLVGCWIADEKVVCAVKFKGEGGRDWLVLKDADGTVLDALAYVFPPGFKCAPEGATWINYSGTLTLGDSTEVCGLCRRVPHVSGNDAQTAIYSCGKCVSPIAGTLQKWNDDNKLLRKEMQNLGWSHKLDSKGEIV